MIHLQMEMVIEVVILLKEGMLHFSEMDQPTKTFEDRSPLDVHG